MRSNINSLWREVTESLSLLKVTVATVRWVIRHCTNKAAVPHQLRFVALMALGIILVTSGGYITSVVIGRAAAGDAEGAYSALLLLFLIFSLLRLVDYFRTKSWEWVYSTCIPLLYDAVFGLFFEKPLGQIKAHASTLNHASVERGHNRALTMIETIAYQILPIILEMTVGLVGLLVVTPWLGLYALLMAMVHLASSVFLNRYILDRMEPIERQYRAFCYRWVEGIEKVVHIVTMGAAMRERRFLNDWQNRLMNEDKEAWVRFALLRNLRDIVTTGFAPVVVAWWLASSILAGSMTPAETIPILLWFGMVAHAVSRWNEAERNILESAVRVRMMVEILTMPKWFGMEEGERLIRNGPVEVRFENVSFGYHAGGTQENRVLENISFIVPAGKSVALLGPTGAGKSTILELALGFMRPCEGRVLVNGTDLSTIDLSSYYDVCAYVPQDPQVLDGTLRENLLFGIPLVLRGDWDDERLWNLVRLLQVDFGETRLTRGLETIIGRNGQQLSGGQRQRLAIANAMMRNPRFLVIDEGTSSLDSATERLVVEGIKSAADGVTTMVIAHRLQSVAHCDQFVFIDRPLCEGGSHVIAVAHSLGELANRVPRFRELARLQGLSL